MNILLKPRTKWHVIEFFNKTQDDELKKLFPFSNDSLEDALILFENSISINSTSFGNTIYCDNKYIGDIWVYCIDEQDEKMAMLSIVIFDKTYWGQKIGTTAINRFSKIVFEKYKIDKIGAFTYAYNIPSIKSLIKNNFNLIEEFEENGVLSNYYELSNNN